MIPVLKKARKNEKKNTYSPITSEKYRVTLYIPVNNALIVKVGQCS